MSSSSSLIDNGNTKGIIIKNWSITSTKLPILNAPESESAAASLHLPLPEICFGNNRLKLERLNSNLNQQSLILEWNTLSALKLVKEESGVKVAHAAEWARGQAASGSAGVSVQKPFDWTYTTLYPGSIHSSTSPSTSTPPSSSSDRNIPLSFQPAPITHPGIPLHLLARQDIPILFFDEIPLFEDELGDNGIAELVVRVRVNDTSFFVLQRFFLRIDHVLFRIFDVRIFHTFGSNEILRETKGRQATYDEVKKRLPKENPKDLTPLTDINWVSSVLETIANSAPSIRPESNLDGTGLSLKPLSLEDEDVVVVGSEEGDSGKWSAEGRKLEIMILGEVVLVKK